MGLTQKDSIIVGGDEQQRPITVLRRSGAKPGLFWLGGYRSDMVGTKAETVDRFGAERDLAVTRFDYSGHGRSGGRFEEGTISRWLEESRAVFDSTTGSQILVGSSMGGWLALLLAEGLREEDHDGRIEGIVLIAPAVDMTQQLMWDTMSNAERSALAEDGVVFQENQYEGPPTPITLKLIEDGKHHLFGDRLISTGCRVHILQGVEDREVPPGVAADLLERLASDDAVLTLVKDGDHRLSREQDLDLLSSAIAQMIDRH